MAATMTYYPSSPVKPGTVLAVHGTGCGANISLQLVWADWKHTANFKSRADGTYDFNFTVPTGATDGPKSFVTINANTGAIIASTTVTVQASATPQPGVPTVPTSFTATAGDTLVADLAWAAPSSNGGSAITGYRIYRNGALIKTLLVVTSYQDTGLVGGTSYTYQVSAVSAVGEGPKTTGITIIAVAPVSGTYYLTISRTALLALPVTGTPYNAMKAVADSSWPAPELDDQDSKVNVMALSAAFVYARTGTGSYRTKVRNAIAAMIPTYNLSQDAGLGPIRQIPGWVMAADLIDLKTLDPTLNTSFKNDVLLKALNSPIGSHTRWGGSIKICHNDSDNNWGGWAGASRIAIDLYVGDTVDLAAAIKTMKGFLGDRTQWSQFRYQKMSASANIQSWACDGSQSGWVPLNGACSRNGINLDGIVPADTSRDDVPLQWPPTASGKEYTSDILASLTLQSELLFHNGYPDVYQWQNQAVHRLANVLSRGSFWNLGSVQYPTPWIINARYGTTYPTVAAGYGRSYGFTDWLHA